MKQKNLYQMIITTEGSNKALKSYYSSTIKEGMKTAKQINSKKSASEGIYIITIYNNGNDHPIRQYMLI